LNLYVDNGRWWKNNHVIDFIRNTLERTVDNLETQIQEEAATAVLRNENRISGR